MATEPKKDDAQILEDERNWTEGIADAHRTLEAYTEQILALGEEIKSVEKTLPELSDGTVEGAAAVRGAKVRLAGLEFQVFGTTAAKVALEEHVASLQSDLASIAPDLVRINKATS